MLNWMHILWVAVICTGVLLGCFHLLLWMRQRSQPAPALVAALSFLMAICGSLEMRAFLATSPDEYAVALRWGHAVTQVIVLVLIAHVHVVVPGRAWLAGVAAAARLAVLAANFGTGVTVSYQSIAAMRPVSTLGGATFMAPLGTANPWFAVAQVSNLLLLAYLLDRLLALWRQPPSRQRRRGLQVLGALLLIVVVGSSSGIAAVLLGAPVPATLSIALLGFAVILTAQVADDLLQAGDLARRLSLSTSNLEELSGNLRLVEESASLGSWHWEAGSDRVRLSERGARIFEHGAGEFGLAELLSAIDPDDWRRVRDAASAIVAAADSEFGGQFVVVGVRGTRRRVAIHGRLVRDAQQVPVRAQGIVIDISSQDGSDAVFGAVFDASPIAILLVDERGRIARTNEAAAQLSGYPVADLVGMAIDALVPPEVQGEHAEMRRRYAATATRRAMKPMREVQLLTRDGARRAVRITLDPLLFGGRSMVIASVHDHTEERRQEHERGLQRAALAHVARVGMLAELSGSLAHEINQPLAAILSNAQASIRFLGRAEPDLAEVAAGLKEVVDNAKRAGDVIRRLRAMLRNDPPEFVELDVRDKIADVVDILHSDLVERRIQVRTHFDDGLPAIRGDRVQLQQVLINLLVNAADAMVDVEGERRISVTARASDQGVLIEVCDVGTGIPEADLDRIFQAFVTTKAEGLGFGLPLCRTLVIAHGGKLWASNNEGPGATFHLLLPAAA